MLIYTFRTFPKRAELKSEFNHVFTFGKLNEDLARFFDLVDKIQPSLIVGVAATKDQSRFEPLAINRFQKSKKVSHGQPDALELAIPDLTNTSFEIATLPTSSFCNWTAYKIKNHLQSSQPAPTFYFVHINPKDLPMLKAVLLQNTSRL